MIQDTRIGVIGGDVRSAVMAKELAGMGYSVLVYAIPEENFGDKVTCCGELCQCTDKANVFILPLPLSIDKKHISTPLYDKPLLIGELFESIAPNALVMGGRVEDEALRIAQSRGIKLIDYLDSEELSIRNAVPTAEGALELAMHELDITLHSARALVLGYGRIGKLLSYDLHALGAKVTVSARRESDRTFAQIRGYQSIHTDSLAEYIHDFDVIFNTVPHPLLNEDILKHIPRQTLIIDLASKPGGVDRQAAKELGSRVIWALSLPGKVAPVSAGRAIASAVSSILKREGRL